MCGIICADEEEQANPKNIHPKIVSQRERKKKKRPELLAPDPPFVDIISSRRAAPQ